MLNKDTISYRRVGDYLIPNLILPPEEASVRLGKWGMMHKDYLEKHNPVFFAILLTQGKLYQHCAQIDTQAQQMFDTLVERMKIAEGVNEQLKDGNQIEWIKKFTNIQSRATEIANRMIVFS